MIKTKSDLSVFQKIAVAFAGALLVGFMWHVRGQHGFGAKWGMFAVAFALMLFVYVAFGKNGKMNYEFIPLSAALAAITAGGWGTLNSQIGGVLSSSYPFQGEEVFRYTPISTYSGWAIMFLLGFGWLPLFSIALGSLFSSKKYEFKDFVIFIGVYTITTTICNFTLSHYILDVINPQAVECCAEGLADAGVSMSPMKAFNLNFGSAAWAKRIPYCRNYFQSIKVISSAVGAITSSAAVGVVLKDKFTAVFSVLSNAFCGIGISVASLFLAMSTEERTVFTDVNLPQFISANAWELWEYFTGFIYGLLLFAAIALLPSKCVRQEEYEHKPMFNSKKFTIFYNEVFTLLFSFGVVLARGIGFRAPRTLFENDVVETIITMILSVLAYFLFVRKIITRNMRDSGLDTPFDMSPQDFAKKSLPVFVGVCAIAYFFMGGDCTQNILAVDYGTLFSDGGIKQLWNSGALTDVALMLPTFILFMLTHRFISRKAN